MSIEAMKQALEALELCNGAETAEGVVIYTNKEITSLRQALSEAQLSVNENSHAIEQASSVSSIQSDKTSDAEKQDVEQSSTESKETFDQPVAWQWLNTAHFRKRLPKDAEKGAWNPLYAASRREWVAVECPLCGEMAVAHTHPVLNKREWVGLTPTDFDWLEQVFANKVSNDFVFADIVCVISAKLKELNHAT